LREPKVCRASFLSKRPIIHARNTADWQGRVLSLYTRSKRTVQVGWRFGRRFGDDGLVTGQWRPRICVAPAIRLWWDAPAGLRCADGWGVPFLLTAGL